MKYIVDYSEIETSFINIDNIVEEYTILEGKVGDWLFKAPKVRKLQEKANAKRLEAVRLEAKQRIEIDAAIEKGGSVDRGRLWELLQQKLDALEDIAKEYEDEAIAATEGNEYLRKVRRVTRLKGVIKMNQEKIAVAESEEKRELAKVNKEYTKVIRDESREINDKIKEDKQKMAAEKKKEQIKDKEKSKEDTYGDYFRNKKAENMRKGK